PRGRPRGRPRLSEGAPVLTREAIAATALAIAGAEGFAAVTMQRLSGDLGVTPRALYNHIENRQEVIDLAAGLMLRSIPAPRLDPATWQDSLRTAYVEGRQAYRSFPRALLLSLEETVTAGEIDPARITLAEDMLAFFTKIGLTLAQAAAARTGFLIDLFGFVLLIDHRHDQAPPSARAGLTQPVPRPWLDAHPEVPAPLSRQAAQVPPPTTDEMFEALGDSRTAAIAHQLAHR